MQIGAGISRLSGHRVTLFAVLFSQPQSDRTAREIRQKERFVLQILS